MGTGSAASADGSLTMITCGWAWRAEGLRLTDAGGRLIGSGDAGCAGWRPRAARCCSLRSQPRAVRLAGAEVFAQELSAWVRVSVLPGCVASAPPQVKMRFRTGPVGKEPQPEDCGRRDTPTWYGFPRSTYALTCVGGVNAALLAPNLGTARHRGTHSGSSPAPSRPQAGAGGRVGLDPHPRVGRPWPT